MNDQPMSSGDQIKIVIFGLFLIPPTLLLFGLIPVAFLLFGVFMMKQHGDFSHVATAARVFNGYVWLALIGLMAFSGYAFTTLEHEDHWRRMGSDLEIAIFYSGVCVFYLVAMPALFFLPLSRHSQWVEKNGIFSNQKRKCIRQVESDDVAIIKSERMKQYSVADELNKWAKLKVDGHVSEEEFVAVRDKLLRQA